MKNFLILLTFSLWPLSSVADIVISHARLQLSPHEAAAPVSLPVIRYTDFSPLGTCDHSYIRAKYIPYQSNTIQIGTERYTIDEGNEHRAHIIKTNDCQLEESEFRSLHLHIRNAAHPNYRLNLEIDFTKKELYLFKKGDRPTYLGSGNFQ